MVVDRSDDNWQACIEAVYDAVGREQSFAASLEPLARHVGASGALFLVPPADKRSKSAHIAATGIDHAALAEYHTHYFAHDTWVMAGAKRGLIVTGYVGRGCDLITDQELEQSYFWRQFLVRYGLTDVLTAVVEGGAAPTIFSFHRSFRSPRHFDQGEVSRMQELLPHLQRALRMHRRLAPEVAIGLTLEQLFQDLALPMIYLDRDARVIGRNASGEACLLAKDVCAVDERGRMTVFDGLKLRSALNLLSHLSAAPYWETITRRANGTLALFRLNLVHGVLTQRFSAIEAFSVATLRSPGPADQDRLMQYFGLTEAERVVTRLLITGLSTSEMVGKLGSSIATIRTHLNHVYEKTGTSRQAELVAVLTGTAPSAQP